MVSFEGALTHADIIEFSNFLYQLKNHRSGSKAVSGFSTYYFNFEMKYDAGAIKKQSSSHLLGFK